MNEILKILGLLNDGVKTMTNSLNDVYKAQMGKEGNGEESTQKIFEMFQKGGINPLALIKSGSGVIFSSIVSELSQQSKLLSDVNTKTGISGDLSEKLRDDMIAVSLEAARYGYKLSDIGELYTSLVEKSGKFSLINQNIINRILPVAASLNKTLPEMTLFINDFEDVGIGMDKTISVLETTIKKTLSLGMSGKKVTDTMSQSIGKLNEYGFKNGIRGLEEMSRKSLEFRMNMTSVFDVAEKVFSPEGAIDFTANMQVLGGVLGDFNDPLKMMYMATNDIGGLQTALINAASSLATYNNEQGRFEITGINLRRGREMAQQMGVSMGELSKISIAAAERVSATTSLMSRGFQMEEKEKEFLLNISRMNGGQMEIVIPKSLEDQLGGEPIKLDKISEKQKDILLLNQKAFEKLDIKDVAMSQLTETQQMARGIEVIASYYKIRGVQLLKNTVKGAYSEELKQLKSSIEGFNLKVDTKFGKEVENDAKKNGVYETLKKNTVDKVNLNLPDFKQMYDDKVNELKRVYIDVKKNIIGSTDDIKIDDKIKEQINNEPQQLKPQRVEHYVKNEHIFRSEALLDGFSREALRNSGYNPTKYVTDERDFTHIQPYVLKT